MKMMLQKYPQKSSLGMMGILKGAIIAETTIFCGVAVTWYALCNYPDFRLTMYRNCRPVLKGFYYILERFSGESPRLEDYKKWKVPEQSPS
ncbi:hypothetical protein LSH36_455g07064 [Paralvinella palmiformis]|uniref:Uncharacterized protein n=1 Tax=Paralvinella palmiformis TaxID=53620 RepID=A0AAD9MXR4_9ANNE|nr:hypothetical protein LSH36_455g07064 [Paralvinella palmiformis]